MMVELYTNYEEKGELRTFMQKMQTLIYSNFEDTVTVYIGSKYGHENFFLLDKFNGGISLPKGGFTRHYGCNETIVNSTEGVNYPQFLSKQTVLRYWRKTLCKVTPLSFNNEEYKYHVNAYRFVLPNKTFDRTDDQKSDCFIGDPPLPNGLADASTCYFDFPVASSFPHFLHGSDVLHTYVDGLNPQSEKHDSFVIVEPTTGVPMESRARSQSNLIMRKMSGFSPPIQRFDNITIPMFWLEYNQVGLPFYISALVYFTVVLLPVLQVIITVVLFVAGAAILFLWFRTKRKNHHYTRNALMQFEREVFLKHS